jgi:prepilin-type N-terminal cleavage/methylation domain-containing protein
MKNNFSLIEMLVSISIIAILVSLLLPSLSKSREEARIVVCKNNLNQMGMMMVMFQDDNDDYFPMCRIPATQISWDDQLSDYDGRNLSLSTKNLVGIVGPRSNLYTCPSDSLTRRDSMLVPMTYGINFAGRRKGSFNRWGKGISGDKIDDTYKGSSRINSLKQPSDTIALAEAAKSTKYLGVAPRGRSGVVGGDFLYYKNKGLNLFHKELYGSNFSLTDGSVRFMTYFQTADASLGMNSNGMWNAID